MLSLVTVSPVITAFHSCCLSHQVFDQVNLWPAWVGFETAIFWQCSPGTVETQRLYPLRGTIKDGFFLSYKSLSGLPESGPYRIFVLVFNWNHFEMRLLNLRINFYLLQTFCPHLGIFFFFVCFFFHYVKFGTDPTLEDQIRIYKTKKIHPCSPFGARGAADRSVESLRFQVTIVRR